MTVLRDRLATEGPQMSAPLPPLSSMDEVAAKPRRRGLLAAAGTAILLCLVLFWWLARPPALDRADITTAMVELAAIEDRILVRATVVPASTVFLDLLQSGRVDRILVENGTFVEEGDVILKLSNGELEREVIAQEAAVTEQIYSAQGLRLALEQNNLILELDQLEATNEVSRLSRRVEAHREMADIGATTREDYQDFVAELDYWEKRKKKIEQIGAQQEQLSNTQFERIDRSIAVLEQRLDTLRGTLDGLVVRAPVAGRLTALDAELGQYKDGNARVGQIDGKEGFRLEASVDEYYLREVQTDTPAKTTIGGETFELVVRHVDPRVENGRFEVTLDFAQAVPEGLQSGQTLSIVLVSGTGKAGPIVPDGIYLDQAEGALYVLAEPEARIARRRDIVLGRRAGGAAEILDGVAVGEIIVTSGHEGVNDAKEFHLR